MACFTSLLTVQTVRTGPRSSSCVDEHWSRQPLAKTPWISSPAVSDGSPAPETIIPNMGIRSRQTDLGQGRQDGSTAASRWSFGVLNPKDRVDVPGNLCDHTRRYGLDHEQG